MRRLALALVVVGGLGTLPATAAATFIPGPNGKIVFTSGRGGAPNNDNEARIWVADWPSGTPQQATTVPAGQHRHPNWSPDHTKIAYAVGTAFNVNGAYAIWIKDLTDGSSVEFVPVANQQDRPSWSPDGTKIAYGRLGGISVKDVSDTSTDPGTQVVANGERPVWSPDGDTLYYNRGAAGNRDLYRKSPVTPGGAETAVISAGTDDWQPALSPDGNTLCYLRGPQSDGADLRKIGVDGTGDTPFATSASGDLNCVWSPDGTRILYTLGAFTAGELVSRDINGGDFTTHSNFNVAQHFDGNADWATNFAPECDDKAVEVPVNGFVGITLSCTDPDSGAGIAAPTPEPLSENSMDIASQPTNGNIGALSDDETVIYTPNLNFEGTDTFTYTGNDGNSDSDPATISITVGDDDGVGPQPGDPRISGLTFSRTRFRRGSALPSAAQSRVGTTISFDLSEAATARFAFQRARKGRRVGGRCRKPTRKNRGKRRCTRYVRAGAFSLALDGGSERVRFEGRLSRRKKLKVGRHRLTLIARDGDGNGSNRPRKKFRILRG